MINLIQVPYDHYSDNEIVRTTLQTKKLSQDNHGVGPHSCWAGVGYMLGGGELRIQTGFSQMRNELEMSPYKNDWVKYHGELSALANAIEAMSNQGHPAGQEFPIVGVYIEMSPCPKCAPALNNLLPDKTTVMYSYDYATQKSDWEKAATVLCK